MAGKGFFRAVEIWTPMADGQTLELSGGLYDDMPYFEAVSRGMTMGRNEGLPGKAWVAGHPVILDNLHNSYFRRGEAASAEALACAIALPIFMHDVPTAVLILFFGDNRYQRGAVEIWNAPAGSDELVLAGGYFGRAEYLARASRDTSFASGKGVPGKTWQSAMPVIVADVPGDDVFLRRDSADQLLIDHAVGIPCTSSDTGSWVMTFVSVRNSPLARRVECWVPDASGRVFELAAGYCEKIGSLTGLQVPVDDGFFTTVRITGVPAICKDLTRLDDTFARVAGAAGLASVVAMPIFDQGSFKAIVAWYQ